MLCPMKPRVIIISIDGFASFYWRDPALRAPVLRRLAERGVLGYPLHRQGEWAELPRRFFKDEMVGSVASHVARRHEPDLLLVHFLCVDSLQHLYGPRSPEAYWAIEYVDGLIGRFLDSLPTA